MWRRAYALLAIVRLFLAVQPSYLHPDEHFQGPEVIAGRVFSFPVHESWEFTSETPIRSAFALWPVYGLPMIILRWLAEGLDHGNVDPMLVFRTLRFVMFMLSFVLEDWAVHELVESRQQRRVALMLVASSYVTWTWQAHTFSNAVETIVVLWSIVLIRRLSGYKTQRSAIRSSAVLAILLVFGTFNRITFPAFVLLPLLQLAYKSLQRPSMIVTILVVGLLTTVTAVLVDTSFYSLNENASLIDLFRHPVITPLNNLLYNTKSANLALHGTHPRYQHFLVNLPQLLGPAILLLLAYPVVNMTLASAVTGTAILSIFPHQEARFLLPAVPLILSSVGLAKRNDRAWIASWIIFNCILGILMGVFHQGGIIQAQAYVRSQPGIAKAFWWKMYMPPRWILGPENTNTTTVDLMGLRSDLLQDRICNVLVGSPPGKHAVLAAPYSATLLDQFSNDDETNTFDKLRLTERWRTSNHLNLDDMEFGDDGVFHTLTRVIGRRGLVVWDVECKGT